VGTEESKWAEPDERGKEMAAQNELDDQEAGVVDNPRTWHGQSDRSDDDE
jgi:hypothetical protein